MGEKISISEINWGDRARQDYGNIDALSLSLKEKGLITPILLHRETKTLVAGGRRLTAAINIGWTTIDVNYKDEMIIYGLFLNGLRLNCTPCPAVRAGLVARVLLIQRRRCR